VRLYQKKGNPMIKRVYTLVYNDDIFGFCGRPYYRALLPIYKGRINYYTGELLPIKKWGKLLNLRVDKVPREVNKFITKIIHKEYDEIIGARKIPPCWDE